MIILMIIIEAAEEQVRPPHTRRRALSGLPAEEEVGGESPFRCSLPLEGSKGVPRNGGRK